MPATFSFRRFGRTWQLDLETPADLRRVTDLPEAHWVAVSAPVETLRADETFLRLVDTDGDGRIRPFELVQAIRWAFALLRDPEEMARGLAPLPLDGIDGEHEDGRRVVETARRILRHLGAPEGNIELGQVRAARAKATEVNAAARVRAESAAEPEVAALVRDVLTVTDADALDAGLLDRFAAEARAWLTWRAQGDGEGNALRPFGADTAARYASFEALAPKIDQYFAQARAVALDPALGEHFRPTPEALGALDLRDRAVIDEVVRSAPIAPPDAAGLRLDGELNPAWAEALTTFRDNVIRPRLGPVEVLEEPAWRDLRTLFAPHREWLAARPATAVGTLGRARLEAHLRPAILDAARALLTEAERQMLPLADLDRVERLLLYRAHLLRLARNYVSFPDLYLRSRRALFDLGDLVMDGRRFNLAVRVQDRAAHAKIAQTSNIYVIYVRVSGTGVEPFEVAVAVTSGGRGNLAVGKRGLFFDVRGQQYDAQVVQVVDNPISLYEAVVAPIRRLGEVITGKLEAITSGAEKKLEETGAAAVSTVHEAVVPGKAEQARGGVIAGGGIAIAALGSGLAFMTSTLAQLRWFEIVGGVVGALLAVLLPALLIALIKLGRRDLSGVLEGSGWAINLPMRLTWSQARYFTERPPLPRGARRRGHPRWRWLWLLAVPVAALGLWLALR